MMNMCAVAGLASSGTAREAASIFRSALTSPCGDAGDRRAAGVGVELARPRNRRLNQHRRDRREDDRRRAARSDSALRSIVAPPPPKNIAKRDDHHDRGGERRRDRADQDVAVLHVRELVRDHAFELRRRSGSAGCPRSPRPPRAPGCGPSQTRSASDLGNDVAARHAAGRRAPPGALTTRYSRWSGPTSCAPIHRQHDLVREPVRREVGRRRRTGSR